MGCVRSLNLANSGPALIASLVICCMYFWFNSHYDRSEVLQVVDSDPDQPTLGPVEEETILAFQGVQSCKDMLAIPRGSNLHKAYDAKLKSFVKERVIDSVTLEIDRERERELMRMLASRLPGVESICITSVQPLADLYVWFISNKNSMVYLVGSSEMDIKGISSTVLHSKFKRRVRVPIEAVADAGLGNLEASCDLFLISQLTDETVWKNLKVLRKIANTKRSYIIFEGYRRGTFLSRVWDDAKKNRELSELLKCRQNGNIYDIIGRIEWDKIGKNK